MNRTHQATVRTILAALLTATLVLGGVGTAPPAEAARKACAGKTKNTIKHTYRTKAGLVVPLRCGTDYGSNRGFGVRHLQSHHRYNPWYRGMIGATLQNPHTAWWEGTTRIYVTDWFRSCRPVYRFKVIVQTDPKDGTKLMRGVITAYRQTRK